MGYAEFVLENYPIKAKYRELKNQVGKIMTDPITDMFNRIRNAQAVSKEKVYIPFSSLKFHIATVLERKGFIGEIRKRKQKNKKIIEIILKYNDQGAPVISGIKKVSKPGQRIYAKSGQIRIAKGGHGITIVSTPSGVITGREAKKRGLGGEVIAEIW